MKETNGTEVGTDGLVVNRTCATKRHRVSSEAGRGGMENRVQKVRKRLHPDSYEERVALEMPLSRYD